MHTSLAFSPAVILALKQLVDKHASTKVSQGFLQ